ncbi:HD domain-containing phosphohydrolase [Fundidesulfovibrio soli]|uniref:HD domain-containing phosphohydrolase n=1 Tax=Fundidesulfovibrio soli TaxID=2922716 RepID=UPI001FAEE2CA|nr:HD domain-containing phosphohydrolase [Fundidesulfovibrio soli]
MSTAGTSILLVDDEPELLEVCAEALSDLAGKISTAGDGLQAATLIAQESYDLVISDLRMPGAGGMDLIKSVSRISPGTDVIVLTGFGTIDNAVECVRLGAVNYLLKPFRVESLRSAVIKALDERSMRQQQKAVSDLSRMLDLNNALSIQKDSKSLIKEFLLQVRSSFMPDGIAFFYGGSPNGNGNGNGNGVHGGRHVLIGPHFRDHPEVRAWFESLAGSLANRGRPLLLEEQLLRQAFGQRVSEGAVPASAIGVSVSGPEGTPGAVVALRAEGSSPYSLSDLHLLTLFAAHASLCFESHWACTRLKSVNDEIVFSLVHAVEAKDTYTRGHSERVSRYAARLGKFIGLEQREVDLVRTAGMLHDVGKIGVPDSILNKPAILEPHELPVMRQHPAIARNILGKVASLTDVLPVVYHHHERFDGTGYPDGLKGEDIPFLARLISVADGFEAMTTDRAYHRARSVDAARAILANGAGRQWDPGLVQAWLKLLDAGGLGAP